MKEEQTPPPWWSDLTRIANEKVPRLTRIVTENVPFLQDVQTEDYSRQNNHWDVKAFGIR
jgi:hypothetical protein